MKPSTVLKKARKLIERGWCKGPFATDKRGRDVPENARTACHWCAAGAINRLTRGKGQEIALIGLEAKNFVSEAVGEHLIDFNDAPQRRKPQVLRAFDRAIKLAESEGK